MIIYTGQNTAIYIDVNDNSYRSRQLTGDNTVTLYFSVSEYIDIPVGSRCEFQGENYELLTSPTVKKINTRNFEYTAVFEGNSGKLKKYLFREVVIENGDINSEQRLKFSYTANPLQHIQMLVDNLNMRDSGWHTGECIDGAAKVISYNHTNCIDALNQIANEFETEWEIAGKTISLRKVEYNKESPLALSYGRGNGFKTGVGKTSSDNAVEILFVQGGSRNIDPSKYNNRHELLLPSNQTVRFDGTYFEDENGFVVENSKEYITDSYGFSIHLNIAPKTGREDSLDLSNIYPHRVGTISEVVAENEESYFYDIVDNSIPENLNYEECLIEGEELLIVFQDGMLAGKEFEAKYEHATRKFLIVPQEIDGQTMPNAIFSPQAGNKYAVFNMWMPQAYICNNDTKSGASWEMFRQAVKYLYAHEVAHFTFSGELDGIWAKKQWLNIGVKIKTGGYIKFSDNQFQPEGVLIRITGIKEYINNPHSPIIEMSNAPAASSIYSKIKKIESNEVVNENRHSDAINFTKRNFRDAMETIQLIADAQLDEFSAATNPVAVQTMQLLAGSKQLQFLFGDFDINNRFQQAYHYTRWNAAEKELYLSYSNIQHQTLGINSIQKTHGNSEKLHFSVNSHTAVLNNPEKAYYCYVRVLKTGENSGDFELSETSRRFDDGSDYYNFLAYIIGREDEAGERSMTRMFGFTEILPGQITTDIIRSADGKTYFDLINNIISGKINFKDGLISSEIALASSTDGKITAGLQGNSDVNLGMWLGGTYEQALNSLAKVILNKDGSGQLLGGLFKFTSDNKLIINLDNFKIDESGNIGITGKFQSSSNGDRIIIDPENKSIQMINSNNKTVADMAFYNIDQIGSAARINYYSYDSSGNINGNTTIFPGRIILSNKTMSFIDIGLDNGFVGTGNLNFFIEPTLLPTSAKYVGQVYRNGNNLCLKIS